MSMESAIKVLSTMPTPEQKAETIKAPDAKIISKPIELPKVESVPTESTVPAVLPPKDDSSSKFAALAKRERGLVQKQNEIKSKEAAYAAKEAEIAAREAKIKESESLWETDIFAALEKRGYTYQKLTDLMLSGKAVAEKAPQDPSEMVAKRLEEFEKRQNDKETAREAAQRKAAEDAQKTQDQALAAAYQNFKAEIADFAKANETDYELINLYEQSELVVDTVQGYFDKHNKVLSHKEACDIVEKYLEDEAQKALKSKKFSKSSTPTEKKEERAAPTKTLSNDLNPTSSSSASRTDNDRMKRALEKLGG